MTTTQAPAPRPTLVPAPAPSAPPAAAASDDVDVDAQWEKTLAQAERYLAGPSVNFSPAAMWGEIKQLFKKLRQDEIAPLAGNVDALVEQYENEESLADHAETFTGKVSAFILALCVEAKFLDEKGAWVGPPALKAQLDAIDSATADFRAHIAQTRVIEAETGAVDPNAPEGTPGTGEGDGEGEGEGDGDGDDDDDGEGEGEGGGADGDDDGARG